MKRGFLAKLHINGIYYISSAIVLLIAVPLYQLLLLLPQGYGDALSAISSKGSYSAYLFWLSNHSGLFLGYRILLLCAFALLLSLPFLLFRIIIAQEILGREDEEEGTDRTHKQEAEGMPEYAWRGKGFAVIAAWAGLFGIAFYLLGTLISSIYLFAVSLGFSRSSQVPGSVATLSSAFTLLANTLGGGLLALALLFFGAIIARSGRNLWPGIWVAFGYAALVVAALFSGSAVAVASAPTEGQAALTTPAILLFALWVLWLGVMLVRLKPEKQQA